MRTSCWTAGERVWVWSLMVCLFTAVIGTARPVYADPDPLARPASAQARERLARGNKLYALREFDAAIAEYKAGALLEDAPVFQYNLAQAYRLSGRYQDALWHYDRFVKRTHPVDPLKSAIEQFQAQMKAELDQAASKQPPMEAAPADASQPRSAPGPTPGQVPGPPTNARRGAWYEDRLGWAVTGAGAALTATAAILLISARSLDQDALEQPQESRRRALQDRADTRRLTGYLIGGAGLVTVGLGTVRLVLHSDGRSHAMVALAGRF